MNPKFFETKIFREPLFLGFKFFWIQIIRNQQNFQGPKFLGPKSFQNQNILGPKIFMTQKKYHYQIHDIPKIKIEYSVSKK